MINIFLMNVANVPICYWKIFFMSDQLF